MRNLVILRGSPGSGKSTWVKENGLKDYTLCADDLRTLVQSPVLELEKGQYSISQKNDNYVWTLLMELLEKRMEKGEFVVIDATHSRQSDFTKYNKLCERYRYRKYVVDFTDVPINECKRRNANREPYKRVPEEAIDKMYARFVSQNKTSGYKELSKDSFKDEISFKPIDMDKYTKIHIFGDIHGCFTPLNEYFKMYPVKEDEMYIFCGDYLDRGIENKETLELLIQLCEYKNVLFLEGNHEKWLWYYSFDEVERIKSRTFLHRTIPQIQDIPKEKIRAFYRKIGQIAYFNFDGKTYIVTHGGLSYVPEHLEYVSTDTFINGIGDYSVDIDKVFSENIDKYMEEWKPIKGYEDSYEISTYGRVRSLPRTVINKNGIKNHYKERILSQSLSTKGYPKVIITKNGKEKCIFPHRLVAETFIPNPDNLPEVNHLDENKLNNHVSNLCWVTTKENCNYGTRNYRMSKNHKKGVILDKTKPYKKIKPNNCFTSVLDKEIFQVHAHRNSADIQYEDMKYSFNLESKVEFGGFLRVLRLTKGKDKPSMVQMKNPVIGKDDFEESRPVKDGLVMPEVPILEQLQNSRLIKETKITDKISSFNFTRNAFYDKKWNKLTTSARGLFMNVETGEVVARGYNKFFNINETKETDLLHLSIKFKDKITCYTKYNGFLGIISWVDDDFFIASKSTTEGEHAEIFRNVLDNSGINKEELKEYLKNNNVSLTFEVIDPVNDPHIIEYYKPRLILLDIIENSLEYSKRPYSEVKELGQKINSEYKLIYKEFDSYRDFYTWYVMATEEDNFEEKIEGVVVECGDIMTKLKFPYYNFWKFMRGFKEGFKRGHKINYSKLYNAESNHFYNFLKTLSEEELEKDIITLRKMFNNYIDENIK